MPSASSEHELLAELFRERPALAAELLALLGVLPAPGATPALLASARLDSESFRQLEPPQYAADQVVLFGPPARPLFAVVVEVQRSRDERKRRYRLAAPAWSVKRRPPGAPPRSPADPADPRRAAAGKSARRAPGAAALRQSWFPWCHTTAHALR